MLSFPAPSNALHPKPLCCFPKLPSALRLYRNLLLLFLLSMTINLAWQFSTGRPLLNARLWSPGWDRFGDFWHYRVLFANFHKLAFFTSPEHFAYPAPCAILYAVLYSLGPHAQLFFDLLLWAVALFSGALLLRAWVHEGLCWQPALGLLLLTGLGSHPWHMLHDRANIELFVYILTASGMWAFLLGNHRLAASLWGAAGALKIYPLLLLTVYLRRRDWGTLLLGALVCAAILLLSFWYVGPSIRVAFLGMVNGVHGFTRNYGGLARRNELFFDHSLLGFVKQILTIRSSEQWSPQPTTQKIYDAAVMVALPVLYFRRFRYLPALNQICILFLMMVLLPPVSYDYTLIHTYLVFGVLSTLYLRSLRDSRPVHAAAWQFAAFAVLSTPQNYLRIGTLDVNGPLKCLALLTILVTLFRYPLETAAEEEVRGPFPLVFQPQS